jgi:hypothetical protein
MEIDTGHAVQFERPGELAVALLEFIRTHDASCPTATREDEPLPKCANAH